MVAKSNQALSERQAILDTFSPSEIQQFGNIVGGDQLTPEQIRALGFESIVDGEIGRLSWASRGENRFEPLNHLARTEVNHNDITPPDVPNQIRSLKERTP